MRSMLMVTYIPAGWSAHDKMLAKHLSFEVFAQQSEKSSTRFHLVGCQCWLFTAEPRSPKTLKDWLCLQIWGGNKGPFGDRCTFLPKTCKTANTENIGASNTNCVCWFPAVGVVVGVYQSFQRENIQWTTPCVLRENKPMDSDSIREKIGLQGIET